MSSLERPLSGRILVVDLREEAPEQEPAPQARHSRTLIKHQRLRVTRVALGPGGVLAEHYAPGPITVQPLEGHLTFTAAGATYELTPGKLLLAAPGVRHTVAAPGGATFLLTLAPVGETDQPSSVAIAARGDARPAGPEAWLRGPIEGISAALMPIAHALVQAREDLHRAAADLTPEELWMTPGGAASIGFHLRHIVGSLDRLLTYARDEGLSDEQRTALAREGQAGTPSEPAASLLSAVTDAIESALRVLRATSNETLLDLRQVGRARLRTNLLGLLFHSAEHTQRHVGQVVTTARIVRGLGLGAQ
ncbi:MAG: DinB family protein [Gemmatimonadales bacterium]